jgi:hypothetical protein
MSCPSLLERQSKASQRLRRSSWSNPSISAYLMSSRSQKLNQAREECTAQLNRLRAALSTLESLGIEMTDLVEQQQSVEVIRAYPI